MKKLFVSGILAVMAIALLSGCGQSRKLGCPSVAKDNQKQVSAQS